jgi:hypothetical protein
MMSPKRTLTKVKFHGTRIYGAPQFFRIAGPPLKHKPGSLEVDWPEYN